MYCMKLIDTHCHIHSSDYKLDGDEVYARSVKEGVFKMICVGTDIEDSKLAVTFVKNHKAAYASIGVHPHYAKNGIVGLKDLVKENKVVAVGEIGLDYFYENSSREDQIKILEEQIQLAIENNLPIIFHIREAFDDFWPVLANFTAVRGVLHSFTDSMENLERAVSLGLYVGVNGIATFTKDRSQIEMFSKIPLDNLVLETDAPYLTPKSRRGKVNEPVFVGEVAEYLSTARSTSVDELALRTTQNATNLFNL